MLARQVFHYCIIVRSIYLTYSVSFFSAWISEIMAVITGDDLARDITGAEAMLSRNREHKAEIDSHQEAVTRFRHTGKTLIDNGHFLSEEVKANKYLVDFVPVL